MSWLWGSNKEPKPEKRKRVQVPQVSDVARPQPSIQPSLLDSFEGDCIEEVELINDSRLFGPEDPVKLSAHLPQRILGCKWRNIYSTFTHGISSSTLIRSSREFGGCNLMIIKDTMGYVFGAFASHQWYNPEPHFYGNGECFLFQLHPDFRVYKWSSKNCYCQMIENNRIIMGGGSGIFGLYLDEDLLTGSTHPCETFENQVLSSSSHFKTVGLELWAFDE